MAKYPEGLMKIRLYKGIGWVVFVKFEDRFKPTNKRKSPDGNAMFTVKLNLDISQSWLGRPISCTLQVGCLNYIDC